MVILQLIIPIDCFPVKVFQHLLCLTRGHLLVGSRFPLISFSGVSYKFYYNTESRSGPHDLDGFDSLLAY